MIQKHILISIAKLYLIFSFPGLMEAQDYHRLHTEAIVVDLHNDAIDRFLRGQSIESRTKLGHVDFERLKEGGVDIAFFAIWPDARKYQPDSMYIRANLMLDSILSLIDRNRDKVELLKDPKDINSILLNNKIAIGIGIEDGSAIESDINKLDYFHNKGIRYITLTWNYNNKIASSSQDEMNTFSKESGLTEYGKKVIQRMNELGIIVDISHAGPKTFEEVLKTSSKPVIASHSSVYNICRHHRNLKDWQIKALAEKRGVIFINFSPSYIKNGFHEIYRTSRKKADTIEDSIAAGLFKQPFNRSAFIHQHIDPIYPAIEDVVDHIDYIIKLVGDDYVGLGSDFDGIPLTPTGLEDISKMPNITRELLRRGHSKKTIEKVMGGNFIRIFQEVSDL